jgi:Lambda phage tail tube protein, TTP
MLLLAAVLVVALHPIGAFVLLALLFTALKAVKAFGSIAFIKWLVSSIVAFFSSLPVLFGTTVAYPGYGSHLGNGGTAGSSYTNIAQLKKFAFDGIEVDFDEITNLDSPSIWKEWMKTLADAKEVSFDGVLNPTDPTTQGLLTQIGTSGSSALNYWKITTTDGTTIVFTGYVSKFKTGVEYNKAILFSGAVKVTSSPTFTWS